MTERESGHDDAMGDQAQTGAAAQREQYKAVKNRALRLLSRREHSQFELSKRLLAGIAGKPETRPEPDIVEAVMAMLIEKDLQSDQRFVEMLTRTMGRRHGLSRLQQRLKQHQIDAQSIARVTQDQQGGEFDRAFQVWSNKFDHLPEDWAEKGRQGRFLAYRGFASDTIKRVLAGQRPETDDDV